MYYIDLKNKTSRDNGDLTAQGIVILDFPRPFHKFIYYHNFSSIFYSRVISLQVRIGKYSSQLLLTCKIFEDCTQFVVEETAFQAFTLLEYAQKPCRQFLPLQ